MKHRHHKVPRHMGGTDDPDNLVLLTIEEHAEAHRIFGNNMVRKLITWHGKCYLVKPVNKKLC